ncbi:MAG: hypothetical protein JKY02_01355 [Flavobacteriaceae bacterium]|nr:hypothetical protein [Flavobacteriaceae bacterium]
MKKLLILLGLVLFIPILFFSFNTDAHVYAYMGRLLVNGDVPYVDGWDHKGISMYFINAFGYLIGFKSIVGIRILELLLLFYSFSKIYTRLSENYTKQIAFMSVVIGLFTMKYFFDGGNLTEEYGAIFTLIAVSLLLKDKIRTIDYGIIGALFVINFTIRANLISFWVALFLLYTFQVLLKKISIKTFLLNFLKMGYGAAVVVASLLIYFLSTGSMHAFFDAAFTFNFSYSESTVSSTLKTVFLSMKKYHLSIILVVGFVISIKKVLIDKKMGVELLLLFWIPIELYFSNISNRLYAHYFLMWIPLLMLSVVVILSEIKNQFNFSNRRLVIISTLAFAICYYVPSYMTLKDCQKLLFKPTITNSEKISNHVIENYKDASIVVFGNFCDIYNSTRKKAPTRFFYHSVFKYDTALVREMISEFSKEILKERPTLIIDAKRNGMLWLDESNQALIDDDQKRNLREFLSTIKTHYILKEEKYGAHFYTLKENE